MTRKVINYSNRHRRQQQEKAVEGSLIALHCSGVRLKGEEPVACKSNTTIFVKMVDVRSAEALANAISGADWKLAKMRLAKDPSIPILALQCTDCWITAYQDTVKKSGGDMEEIFKQIDPTGKFWDRMGVHQQKP